MIAPKLYIVKITMKDEERCENQNTAKLEIKKQKDT